MKLFISNSELDKQIAEIRKKIYLSMNGVVSDSMAANGIIYKKNYGVSVPQIRSIALQYAPNHDLAQRLWALGIRETMILASLLQPAEKYDENLVTEWMKEVEQIELIEQLCMNLFSKLPYANKLTMKLINSSNAWEQTAGFILSARVYANLTDAESIEIINTGVKNSPTDNLHLYKAIALSLSRIARKDLNTKLKIQQSIDSFSNTDNIGQKYIHHEVKEEILFLDIL